MFEIIVLWLSGLGLYASLYMLADYYKVNHHED